MRYALMAALIAFLAVNGSAVRAADPDPTNSTISASGTPIFGCQFVLHADCQFDVVQVDVVVRDAGNNPVPNAVVWVNLQPNAGTEDACNCLHAAMADAAGQATVSFCDAGGRGSSVDLCVQAAAPGGGPVDLGCVQMPAPHAFTSPDLNGSCESVPPFASSTTVVDLGIWATGLPPNPYYMPSDYNCDGVIGVQDLGIWASGLGHGC